MLFCDDGNSYIETTEMDAVFVHEINNDEPKKYSLGKCNDFLLKDTWQSE